MTDGFVSVSLPQMVASSTMDGESVILVRDYVNELLSWVERVFVRLWCSWICQVDGKREGQDFRKRVWKRVSTVSKYFQNMTNMLYDDVIVISHLAS